MLPASAEYANIIGRRQLRVFDTAPFQDFVVPLTALPDMERMDSFMPARPVERVGQFRRERFVEKKLHAARPQGRPLGRPLNGCARAKIIAASTASRGGSGFSFRTSSVVLPMFDTAEHRVDRHPCPANDGRPPRCIRPQGSSDAGRADTVRFDP